MTFIPLTRCAALAASARTYNRPHRTGWVPVATAELAHRLLGLPADERRKEIAELHDATLMDVMIALDWHTSSAYELWRDTPSGFAEDVLGLALTDAHRAVLDAAAGRDVRCVAARVPHPDNHLLAAVLMAWAALVSCPRPYGDVPRVAVSFTPYRNTSASVWRVLARFIDNAHLPGTLDLTRRAWWVDDDGPQRLLAFALWNTDPYAIAGLHQYFAVAADADRIADPDMRAAIGYIAEEVYGGSRLVALGGTTDEPEEWFALYESCDQVTIPADPAK
ncbi:hypothetical protein [Streptomyces cahuitamycinicus]|uniref:Uncharacterized protein n=1 Tax=Streptomyces cahuitamycinicus TaxID=2070367 RepID=A0A2N8TTF8_9ACTN|nr:hypothetical protein [Streptomyces cahuitamycinicus]PNG22316.1 hypothetical protein C1J00_09890 [Streptomyces cahuitamycinicus]